MEKEVRYVALGHDVLVVAVEGEIGDWAAYIGSVPGVSHEREYMEVAQTGNKLRRDVAELLFPDYAAKYEWRY